VTQAPATVRQAELEGPGTWAVAQGATCGKGGPGRVTERRIKGPTPSWARGRLTNPVPRREPPTTTLWSVDPMVTKDGASIFGAGRGRGEPQRRLARPEHCRPLNVGRTDPVTTLSMPLALPTCCSEGFPGRGVPETPSATDL
jgi:hypothetical protein